MRIGIFRRSAALLLAAILLLSLLPVMAWGAEGELICGWDFSSAQDAAESVPATTGTGAAAWSGGAVSFQSAGYFNANHWTTDSWWGFSGMDTRGFTQLGLSFSTYGSSTGPANWEALCSVDQGQSWLSLGTYTVQSKYETKTFALPDQAACESLSLRLRPVDDTSVGGGTVAATGTNRLGKIHVTGIQAGYETLAGFTFDSLRSLPAAADEGYGYLGVNTDGSLSYSTGALASNRWTVDACWMLVFNTSGCTDLKLSADVLSSGTGPANFAVECSADLGVSWTGVDTFTIENTGKLQARTFALPESAQSDNLLVRFRVTEDVAAKGDGSAIGSSGTSKINNIRLTGRIGEGRLPDPDAPTWPEGWNTQEPDQPAPQPGGSGFVNADIVGDPIARWEFSAAANLPAPATLGWGTLSHSTGSFVSYGSGALTQTGWSAGAYWQIVANTSGCSQMTFQLKTSSSSTGPKNLSLRYSKDLGQTWVEFAALSVSGSLKSYVAQLPDDACCTNLIIRVVVANDVSVKGDVIKNGGNNKLNNLAIYGVADPAARQPDPAAPAYPADWTEPVPYDEGGAYVPAPEQSAAVSNFTFAPEDRRILARWGGNANYAGALQVYGDLITANDRLDGRAVLTTVVAGENVSPGFSTSSTNSTNYYLGSSKPCVGSGMDAEDQPTQDYIQMLVSTAKYTDLELRFRLRVSGSGPKGFTLKYSTDGETWHLFDQGSYSYAYTGYGYGGATYEVSGEGMVENGYLPMEVAGQYEEFILPVPAPGENASQLQLRLYADSARADGKDGTVGASASVRIDTVELTGCPMIAPEICDWVRCPAQSSVPSGFALELTTATQGAEIRYTTDLGRTVQRYDPQARPVLTEFPTVLIAWAEKQGLAPSVPTLYRFTQAQVAPVKAAPNGGAVAADTQLKLTCATQEAQIRYSLDGGESWQTYDAENRPVLTAALLETEPTVLVMGVMEGWLSSPVTSLRFSLRQNAKYQLYFGQLHSHTNYSDGAGSCEEAFVHASTEVDNLDFLAVTDHSNAFDNDTAATVYDGSMSAKWVSGHELADRYTNENFVCIYGYEMTWSNGLGHMNTYNTGGFQSRTQAEFSSYATALPNYYDALRSDPNSISQFNHPGTTFGTFQDYAWYDADIDELITIIEVGNGEGTIGSSGYFPSYEEYTRALDLGWHVAPTNNQDNHKGSWGDANTARSVVMADALTRENIYDAIRNRRVYATEDNDFSVYYTLNGYEMGTILTEEDVDDSVTLRAEISDPTDSGSCKIEVVVNGGIVCTSKTAQVLDGEVEFTLPANYSYYYLRLTQADGDIAVTAPVWIGEVESIGVRELKADTELPIQDEPTEITLTLANDETSDLEIHSIEFSVEDEIVHTVDLDQAELTRLKAGETRHYWFDFTWNGIGTTVLNVTVKGAFRGAEKQYNGVLQLNYLPAAMVSNVIVDGTHFNDYVTGAWAGNTTKLAELGADHYARVTVATEPITAAQLENCQLLVLSAPARRTKDEYRTSHFEDEFLSLVSDYVARGGSVVVCGSADFNDSTAAQAHTELNKLLSAVGSTIRLRSDEAVEENEKGEQVYGLELARYDDASVWLTGAREGMTFSVYSACSVDLSDGGANDRVEQAQALVLGNPETFSVDAKTDTGYAGSGQVAVQKGDVVMAALQDTKAGGHILVCGAPFFSDYNMETDEHDYKLNAVLMTNLLQTVAVQLPVTPIAEMRRGELGQVFCVEGWVTNGTDNDKTKFFDTIYIQDDTGGVTVYPFAQEGLAKGTKLRLVGYVDQYQDDRELQVLRYEILEDAPTRLIAPTVLTCAQAMDYATYGGMLVQTQGVITEVSLQGSAVTQLRVQDETGSIATIFIDGYIYSGTTGENTLAGFCKPGNEISAVGMCFMHPETGEETSSCCLRVRDCDEILLIREADPPKPPVNTEALAALVAQAKAVDPDDWTQESAAALQQALDQALSVLDDPEATQTQVDAAAEALLQALDGLEQKPPVFRFDDVQDPSAFYFNPVYWAVDHKPQITNGMTPTTFEPNRSCTRGQVVTFLWRAAGCPEPEAQENPFADVNAAAFYYKPVLWAVEKGITNGMGPGRFNPDGLCTRGQVVTFLYRFAGSPAIDTSSSPFNDLLPGAYYTAPVAWAVQTQITNGMSAVSFAPENICTRGQVVTFLYRQQKGQ